MTRDERLSRAVWDVLATQGLERLTIRAVAAAAGCTTGLVMHRFPNRRALLSHARDLLHQRTRERVERVESHAATPREALRAVLSQGLALDAETAAESVVWTGFLAAAVADEDLVALHRAGNRAWRERITRLVVSVSGWPPERATTVARALIALAEGTAALASADPDAYPPPVQQAMLDVTLEAFSLA
ncbi:TetR/AcrR family transcriptional regulator [Virgisporangium ochraceum]